MGHRLHVYQSGGLREEFVREREREGKAKKMGAVWMHAMHVCMSVLPVAVPFPLQSAATSTVTSQLDSTQMKLNINIRQTDDACHALQRPGYQRLTNRSQPYKPYACSRPVRILPIYPSIHPSIPRQTDRQKTSTSVTASTIRHRVSEGAARRETDSGLKHQQHRR
jgi:hypothetical protein